MKDPTRIPFTRLSVSDREKDLVLSAIASGELGGDGAFGRACERRIEELTGCRRAMLTHSGTGALEMAAILSEVGPGDEVIMPSFTFASTANAFVLRGATPVFVDILPETLNIDPGEIAAAVTKRTRAIVPVHYAGVPCDMNAIGAVAADARATVIEDAAQALLSEYERRMAGSLGVMAALSFHQTKNVTCGEGGALLLNDPSLVGRAEIVREKGTDRSAYYRGEVDRYTWIGVGSSYVASELIAAFLLGQLERAREITVSRQGVWDRYHDELAPLEQRGLLVRPSVCGNAHLYYVLLRSLRVRTRVMASLREAGISAVFHYVPLHSAPAGRRYGRTVGPLAVTEDISGRLLRLPLWPHMTASDVEAVVDALNDALCVRGATES